MTKRILLVGASVRAQVESAIAAGYEVCAFDFFSDWDTNHGVKAACSFGRVEKIDDFCDARIFEAAKECDAAILLGGFETRIELVERLSLVTRILGTSADRLKELNREAEVFRFLCECGITCPETKAQISGQDPDEWIRKKIGSASGNGIRPATELDNSKEYPHVYYQKRISGENVSAVFVSSPTSNFATTTSLLFVSTQLVGEESLGSEKFCYCGSIANPDLPECAIVEIKNCAEALANEYGVRGVWGIDFVVSEQGAFPVDVNARITASAELAESFVKLGGSYLNILDLHVQGCEHETSTLNLPTAQSAAGKVIMFNRLSQPIEITNEVFEKLRAHHFGVVADSGFCELPNIDSCRIADIPWPETIIQPGDPILTLLGSSKYPASTQETLFRKAESIYSALEGSGF